MMDRSRGQQGIGLLEGVAFSAVRFDNPPPPHEDVLSDGQNATREAWSNVVLEPIQERVSSC
jgi:hypothetical protein